MTWTPAHAPFTPLLVAEIELSEPPTITYPASGGAGGGAGGGPAQQALVLVRLHAAPIGTLVTDAPGGAVDPASCAKTAWAGLAPELEAHLEADARARHHPGTGPPGDSRPSCQREAAAVLASPPPVTVIVASRERPHHLAACLDSLARLDYPAYEVVVVDNAPVSGTTAELVRQRAEPYIRYAREDRRGLAAAHNHGLRLAGGTVVAFTDDDVIVDRHWLTEIARAFRADPGVACVTGLIMPAELQTRAQIMLEAHGHFGKGYERRVVDWRTRRPADPLFPFTAGRLGSGANMAFDRDTLRRLGGFDPAIGAGTVARGGDDLASFFAVLAAGRRLAYQPGALVWHRHRRDAASLTDQAYGYGVGLGAYVASILADHPSVIGRAVRLAPAGLAYVLHQDSPRNAGLAGIWPRHLVRLERRGMLFGPLAYGVSRWRSRGARPRRDAAGATA
ncbi:MAG TPA: glycosyltransferase [Streptosporangiaceae bacterium]|nr:glycosyltransferase [Streptosporangiaceae bacterium]